MLASSVGTIERLFFLSQFFWAGQLTTVFFAMRHNMEGY